MFMSTITVCDRDKKREWILFYGLSEDYCVTCRILEGREVGSEQEQKVVLEKQDTARVKVFAYELVLSA